MPRLSQRFSSFPAYPLAHIPARKKALLEAGVDVIDLGAGDADLAPPAAAVAALQQAAEASPAITFTDMSGRWGIDFDRVLDAYAAIAKDCPNLEIKGLQMHIGSQLTSVDPFVEAVKKVVPLVQEVKARHGLKFFSIGGGIGIVYKQSLDSGDSGWWAEQGTDAPLSVQTYADAISPHLETLGLRILLEPGRFMVGNAGVLLTRVLYEKKGNAKTFKIVDAGMNDLIRPTLYEGWHQIVPTQKPNSDVLEKADIVGPICETGDFLAQDREMAPVKEGDLLAVMSAGAYGFTMASNYNTRPLAAEVMVHGAKASLVRSRQTLEDIIRGESLLADAKETA
jgi:diaminopimelate decarboxylase